MSSTDALSSTLQTVLYGTANSSSSATSTSTQSLSSLLTQAQSAKNSSLALSSMSGDTVTLSNNDNGSTQVTYSSTAGVANQTSLAATESRANAVAQSSQTAAISTLSSLTHLTETYGRGDLAVAARRSLNGQQQDATGPFSVVASTSTARQSTSASDAANMGVGVPGSNMGLALNQVASMSTPGMDVQAELNDVYPMPRVD